MMAGGALLSVPPGPAILLPGPTLPLPAMAGPPAGEARPLGPVRIEWLRAGLRSLPRAPDECVLLFQTMRGALATMGGQIVGLECGGWLAVAGSALHLHNPAGGATLCLRVPLDRLSRRLAAQLPAGPPGAGPVRGAARMCLDLARSSLAQPDPMPPRLADAVAESLVELAKLALIDRYCPQRAESVRETVRARIQAFVQRNLADPELSIARIAGRMQCTKRYLHKVFSDEGETLSQYIWSQRLERCRRELARPELAAKSITEIAFACGFSNAAHFSRSFRARYGQPPRAWRQAMLAR
jgi:AraC-like DNA-binding protein